MRSNWVVRALEIGILLAIILAGFGQAVLQLWNLLMPDIFGLRPIGYWQALGLLGLSWILFGGLGLFRMRPVYPTHWRHRMSERLEQMPPAEREKFRQAFEHGCGRGTSTTSNPEA
jgi:hypothetical protein